MRAALSYGKPFAVVPCCVFANSNAHRRLPDGAAVRTHEQLCEYLQGLRLVGQQPDASLGVDARQSVQAQSEAPSESVSCIDKHTLGFEGRNIIVYKYNTPPS